MGKIKIFTWNVHGGYLNALVKTGHNFYVPIKKGRPYNYDGQSIGYIWPKNVKEVKVSEIKKVNFDLLIYQTPQHVTEEQFKVLSEKQRRLPKILIFHSLPKEKIDLKKLDKKIIKLMNEIAYFVHITNYNLRQWKTSKKRSKVIYHGIEIDRGIKWLGKEKKSVTAVNDLLNRLHCGFEFWKDVSSKIPNILIGSNSEKIGGVGVIDNKELKKEFAEYRVYFNPTIKSSIPMTMLEAMSVGLPIVSTATTELPRIIKNGYNGYISNDPKFLINKLKLLIENKSLAEKLGKNAKKTIEEKFSMGRFIKEWNKLIYQVYKGT